MRETLSTHSCKRRIHRWTARCIPQRNESTCQKYVPNAAGTTLAHNTHRGAFISTSCVLSSELAGLGRAFGQLNHVQPGSNRVQIRPLLTGIRHYPKGTDCLQPLEGLESGLERTAESWKGHTWMCRQADRSATLASHRSGLSS